MGKRAAASVPAVRKTPAGRWETILPRRESAPARRKTNLQPSEIDLRRLEMALAFREIHPQPLEIAPALPEIHLQPRRNAPAESRTLLPALEIHLPEQKIHLPKLSRLPATAKNRHDSADETPSPNAAPSRRNPKNRA